MSLAAYIYLYTVAHNPLACSEIYFAARTNRVSVRIQARFGKIAGVSIPFALAGLAASGFYYNRMLSWRLFVTFGLLITFDRGAFSLLSRNA